MALLQCMNHGWIRARKQKTMLGVARVVASGTLAKCANLLELCFLKLILSSPLLLSPHR